VVQTPFFSDVFKYENFDNFGMVKRNEKNEKVQKEGEEIDS
jgi:hypothetical protein